jgi:hypothetical protein
MAVRVAPARSDSPGPHSPLIPALSWMRPARAKQRVNEEQIWIGECLSPPRWQKMHGGIGWEAGGQAGPDAGCHGGAPALLMVSCSREARPRIADKPRPNKALPIRRKVRGARYHRPSRMERTHRRVGRLYASSVALRFPDAQKQALEMDRNADGPRFCSVLAV